MQNSKVGVWFLVFAIVVFISLLIYDSTLKFEYINTHNNTTNLDKIPQILPAIPYQFTDIIFLVVGIIVILGVFMLIIHYLIER